MLLIFGLLVTSFFGALGDVDPGGTPTPTPSPTPGSATNGPPDDGCCDKKVVGGEVYLRADVGDDIDMTDCLEGCAYRKRTALADDIHDQVYCFQSGNLSSSCLGGTALVQELAGTQSSGHVMLDEKLICGDVWDLPASEVVCRELGWGPPVEVAGYANDFLGSLSGLSCHVFFKVVDMSGGGKPLYLRLGVCKTRSGFGSEMHNFHDFFGNLWWPSQNCFHEPLGRPTYTLL